MTGDRSRSSIWNAAEYGPNLTEYLIILYAVDIPFYYIYDLTMRRINHRQIEAFRAAVQLGSATAAAESLYISQPAVTRLISDLERHIGFDLFERRRRGLQPTSDGMVFFEEVEKSFRGLDRIQDLAEAIRSHQIGRLRVIALPVYADRFVARGIGAFLQKSPNVFVELEKANNEGLVESLVSEKYDLGISTSPRMAQGIETADIAKRSAVCVMRTDHRLATRAVIPVEDLVDEPFVTQPQGSPFRLSVERHLGITEPRLTYAAEARTQRSICHIVAAGGGIAIVDPSAFDDLREDLVGVPLDPPLEWSVVAITPLRKTLSMAGQLLLDEIQKQVGN